MKTNKAAFFLFAAVLFTVFAYSFRQNTDPDLGFHLNVGRYIWQHGVIPPNEALTYSGAEKHYLDPHWLYQASLYGAYRLGGYRFLTVVKSLGILLLFLLLALHMKENDVPQLPAALLLASGVFIMEMRFELRPEEVSWILLALTMLLLDRHRRGRKNALRFVPLVMLFWINLHALFILGIAVQVFACLDRKIREGLWDPESLKTLGLSALALFINPNGVAGIFFPFQQWGSMTASIYAQTISEFLKPWSNLRRPGPFQSYGIADLYYFLALGLALLLLVTRRRRSPGEFLLGGSFLYLSTTAVRNIPLFCVAVLPLVGACLADLTSENRERWDSRFDRWRIPAACLIFLFGWRAFTGAQFASERRTAKFGWGLSTPEYPDHCADYLLKNGLTDQRLVNDIQTGNWLGWKCQIRVMVDGRLEALSESAYRDYLHLKDPGGLRRAVDKVGATLATLDPQAFYVPNEQFSNLPGWKPVCLEESCLLAVAPELASRLPDIDWNRLLAERGVPNPEPGDAERILSRPTLSPLQNWFEGFLMKKDFPFGLWTLSGAALMNRRFDKAEALYLEILERTRGAYPEIYMQLADLYNLLGRQDLRQLSIQRCRETGLIRR